MATFDGNTYTLTPDEDNFTIPNPPGHPDADIRGNARANTLTGDAGFNYLYGGLGLDRLIGGDGDDQYYLDVDADDVIVEDADGGYDTVISNFTHALRVNVEALELQGAGNISGFGNAEDNLLFGNSGNNLLDGGAGSDDVYGNDGNDSIFGGLGNDYVGGGKGNDSIEGGGGADSVDAGEGDDIVLGGDGDDYLSGDSGDDTLVGGAGADQYDGGAGSDTVSYATATVGVTVNLAGKGAGGEALGDTYLRIETVIGSALADSLVGDTYSNQLQGGAGNDTLDGGGGWDLLEGGAGDDSYTVDHAFDQVSDSSGVDKVTTKVAAYTLAEGLENLSGSGTLSFALAGNTVSNAIAGGVGADKLSGKLGNDMLTGGAGFDQFVFDTKLHKKTNVDTITDFSFVDDTIYLDRAIFSKIAKGALKASAFKIGPKATDATDRIVYDKKKGVMFYDADGNGKGAAVEFAKVAKMTALSNKDFFIL